MAGLMPSSQLKCKCRTAEVHKMMKAKDSFTVVGLLIDFLLDRKSHVFGSASV